MSYHMQPLYNPIRVLGDKQHMQATLVIMCGRQKGQKVSKRVLACFTKSSLFFPPPFYAELLYTDKIVRHSGRRIWQHLHEYRVSCGSRHCRVTPVLAFSLALLSRSHSRSHSRYEYVLVGTWYETQKGLPVDRRAFLSTSLEITSNFFCSSPWMFTEPPSPC